MMALVSLSLPSTLLRRFRTLAEELLPDAPEPFHLLLRCAAAEAMHALSEAPLVEARRLLEAPPATLVPLLPVHSAVPEAAADFVRELARASGLTTEQAWHRVVVEFCERETSPALGCALAGREAA